MSLTLLKRPSRTDLGWPTWLPGGSLLDWPTLAEVTGDLDVRVEEYQDDGHLVVRAEMPGIDPDKDVEITLTDQVLRIRAERRREEKVETKSGYRSEFHYGSFARSLRLPIGATDKDVQATYEDGILEVRIPIDEHQADEHRISVKRT
mgnify:CR=1 FL=1